MRRYCARLISTLVLVSTAVAVEPAAATAARPAVAPAAAIAGHYTGFLNWNHTGYSRFWLVLNPDHTGTDKYHETIVWSQSGKTFEMTVNGTAVATYHGTKTKAGLNNRRHPGTMSNDIGDSGTWFAVRTEALVPPR
jgi:hypothetical protein